MSRFIVGETPRDTVKLKEELATSNGLPPAALAVAAVPTVSVEDRGEALILEIDGSTGDGNEPNAYFRLVSWDPERRHHLARSLIGKRVEVTIKVVP